MSELITIAKNRKTGKWEILASPDDTFDVHNRIYHKLAAGLPVNDDYEKLIPTRIQPFLTRRTFITTEENKTRLDGQSALESRLANAGKDADDRQKALDDARSKSLAEAHAAALDEKNALINSIRKATNQELLAPTKTEQSQANLSARLATEDRTRPSDVLRAKQAQSAEAAKAIATVPKTNAEILAEKNAVIEATKKQAQENLNQQEQAQADKQARVETKKSQSAKT